MTNSAFDEVEFEQCLFLYEMLEKKVIENEKKDFKTVAFGAWLAGNGGKLNFEKYLENFGLVKKLKLTDEEKKEIAISSLSNAMKIVSADKKRIKK